MKTMFAFVLSIATLHEVSAQITFVGTVNGDISWQTRLTRGLTSAGPKYLEVQPSGFNLYDLDTSPYQSITYPAPPAGYEWYWQTPYYVTEDLFDTDPSSIEFVLFAQPVGSGNFGTAVVRDDGTVLLWDPLKQLGGGPLTSDDVNTSPPIFNTPSGALMRLMDALGVNYVYQLPGMLPCVACDGSLSYGMALGAEDLGGAPVGNMAFFPNPTKDLAEVIFNLAPGIVPRTLVLMDLSGQVVKRIGIPSGADRMTITTADVSSGTYSFHLETDHGLVRGKRLVVVK